MKLKKLTALALAATMLTASFAGCKDKEEKTTEAPAANDTSTGSDSASTSTDDTSEPKEITEFSMFIAMPGNEIDDDNEVQQIIAEKTGVKVKETWLVGQTDAEAIGTIIASGEYTDFINGGEAMSMLYDADVLVPWDDYIDKYPNIKELYTDKEWDMFRQEDGHIYWANAFGNTYGENRTTTHNDEAFWIQARVLEWAGYPEIETLDEYFDVLQKFADANPEFNGMEVIPYTALCDDWRYFCIENAPEFLDGYPNDGSVIVDVENLKIVDYNTTPTAEKYFRKLNEVYNKGYMDIEFATQTYDEYIAKLTTGRVLGMCDQWWDFAYTVNDSFKQQGFDKLGCDYIPLGLTIEKGMENRWHAYGDTLNNSSGIAITKDCKDIDKAFQFINDLLDQEIHNLRFWGVEGVDYLVDEEGMFYRTDEMRMTLSDSAYKASHMCDYSYFPQWGGTSRDGKNAMVPAEQTSEFFSGLAEPVVKVFEAYGAENYPDMIGSVVEEPHIWYPMYSHSNAMTTETPGGVAWVKMGETKHEWLPKIVMASDFDSAWADYMAAYSECKPEDFLAEMQTELERRAALGDE